MGITAAIIVGASAAGSIGAAAINANASNNAVNAQVTQSNNAINLTQANTAKALQLQQGMYQNSLGDIYSGQQQSNAAVSPYLSAGSGALARLYQRMGLPQNSAPQTMGGNGAAPQGAPPQSLGAMYPPQQQAPIAANGGGPVTPDVNNAPPPPASMMTMRRPPMASTQPGGDQTRVLVKWPDGSKSSVPRADYASYQSLGAEAVTA